MIANHHTRLEAIFNDSVDAIISIDEAGIMQTANPATERLFGFSNAEMIGQNVTMLMPSPYQADHDAYLQTYRQTGVRRIIGIGREVVGRRKNGSTFPMHLAVSEFWDGDRRGFVGIVRDISDLKERQSRLEAILNGAIDSIITIDEQGTMLSVNPATNSMFGYQPDELIGQNVKMLMPPPYQQQHDDYLKSYVTTGNAKIIGIGRQVIGLRKDGTTFPMHLAVTELHIGGTRAFTGIVRDISDLKEAERQLIQLNEQLEARVRERTIELRDAQAELVRNEKLATLGQLAGNIAHEIRNPLNAVKTSVYYLVNAKHPSPEKAAEHLERIDRQVTLIDSIITALSDVAKLPIPNLRSQSVIGLLREVIQNTHIPTNVELVWEVPRDVPDVLGDGGQLPIVFRNLIRNALDAMPDGGRLFLRGVRDGSWVHVVVADTGVGIPPQDLARVLEPLYSTKVRGMGLGLAIARAIVDKNGGTLSVESKLGSGSAFSVRLKAASRE